MLSNRFSRMVRHLPVAHHPRMGRAELAQRLHGALGAEVLEEADERVEHDDDHDGNGILRLAHHPGDDGGADQHQDHEVREPGRQHLPGRAAAHHAQLVRAAPLQAARGLGGTQSLLQIGAQSARDIARIDAVPDRRRRGTRFVAVTLHGGTARRN